MPKPSLKQSPMHTKVKWACCSGSQNHSSGMWFSFMVPEGCDDPFLGESKIQRTSIEGLCDIYLLVFTGNKPFVPWETYWWVKLSCRGLNCLLFLVSRRCNRQDESILRWSWCFRFWIWEGFLRKWVLWTYSCGDWQPQLLCYQVSPTSFSKIQ